MKRKDDFITNSSSCAFIFAGWIFDKEKNTVKKLFKQFGQKYDESEGVSYNVYEMFNHKTLSLIVGDGENGFPEGKVGIGIHKSTDEYDTTQFSINEILSLPGNIDKDGFEISDLQIVSGFSLC